MQTFNVIFTGGSINQQRIIAHSLSDQVEERLSENQHIFNMFRYHGTPREKIKINLIHLHCETDVRLYELPEECQEIDGILVNGEKYDGKKYFFFENIPVAIPLVLENDGISTLFSQLIILMLRIRDRGDRGTI